MDYSIGTFYRALAFVLPLPVALPLLPAEADGLAGAGRFAAVVDLLPAEADGLAGAGRFAAVAVPVLLLVGVAIAFHLLTVKGGRP